MAKKYKILQVLPELNSGGVERGTVEIAKAITDAKHESFVISSGGQLVKKLEKNGTLHFKMPVKSKNPILMLINAFRIMRFIKRENIDIVHARSRAPAWSCFLATYLTGVKFITTFHGAYESGHALKRFYNSVMLRGDKVIAVSNYILKHIETRYRFGIGNVTVIHRGVDLEYFDSTKVSSKRKSDMKKTLGIDLKGPVILVPARLTRLKGHLFMLHALKYLHKKEFTCVFVGKYDDAQFEYRHEIEKTIKDYGLEGKVHIVNAVNDMAALYELCNIVVCPTVTAEAFGRTITEAQAMEKVIIATRVGAPMEIINDGKTGYLVSPAEPSELAEKLEHVMKMKDADRKKLLKAAKDKVIKDFSLSKMCEKTLALYKEVMKD